MMIKLENNQHVVTERRPVIYFAHPFDRKGSKREEMITKHLEKRGFEVYDPFVKEDDLNKKYGVESYYDDPTEAFAQEIVARDFEAVDRCKAIFAWIPKGVTTVGTIREIDRAIKTRKRVIVLSYKPSPFFVDVDELYLSYEDFLTDKKYVWK